MTTEPEHGPTGKPMRRPICRCGEVGQRSEEHDAYYCPRSGAWLEDQCGDPDCCYCVERPSASEPRLPDPD